MPNEHQPPAKEDFAGGETTSTGPIYKPDDRRVMLDFATEFQGVYAFLRDEWHRFHPERGVWEQSERQIHREVIEFLASARYTGVKVNSGRVKGVLDLAQHYMPQSDDIPQYPDLIPLRNGVYDIRSGEFTEHKAGHYFFQAMDFDYKKMSSCPNWLDFLDTVIVDEHGETDYETINFMSEMVGYSLWGDNRLQASFFFYGDGGTGKSTCLELMQELTNSRTSIDLEKMKEHDLATLPGVRLVVFNELEKGATIPEAAFKRLVSSDRIVAKRLYQNPFTFQPICTLVGAMNHLPRIKDRSAGVFRRIYVIPFRKRVQKPDVYLPQKLKAELPGIFGWAMMGLKRLRERGRFDPPVNVLRAIEEWRYQEDTERQFLHSHLVLLGRDFQVQSTDLHAAYKAWCYESGLKPKAINTVAEDWKRLGLVMKKDGTTRRVMYHGAGLVSDYPDDSVPPVRSTDEAKPPSQSHLMKPQPQELLP